MPRPLIRCYCPANQAGVEARGRISHHVSTTCKLLPVFRVELADIDRKAAIAERDAVNYFFLAAFALAVKIETDRPTDRQRERERENAFGRDQICEVHPRKSVRFFKHRYKLTRLIKNPFKLLLAPPSKSLPNTLGVIESAANRRRKNNSNGRRCRSSRET